MSELKALEKLRKYTLCDKGERLTAYINAGELADEIEREHNQSIAELRGAVNERDGRIAAYDRANVNLGNALDAICKTVGVETEQSAKYTAIKVREAIERDYMRLPVDADGETIRIGDRLLKSTGAPKKSFGEVVGVSEDSVWFAYENNGYESNWANFTRHVKPRILEDVLEDFAIGVCEEDGYSEERVRRCADEIRELMEAGE